MTFTTQLQQAAAELAARMPMQAVQFNEIDEHLAEGFKLARADEALHADICQNNGLDAGSTELVVMCLTPDFSGGRTYSQPHQHGQQSITAVHPLSAGGTFLPTETDKTLALVEGNCVIEGGKPHAFGLSGEAPFVAALAVGNTKDTGLPIKTQHGYDTQMLDVTSRHGKTLHLS